MIHQLEMIFAKSRNKLPIHLKAWFPYDRPDRPDRPSRLKKCLNDRDDHMETRLKKWGEYIVN